MKVTLTYPHQEKKKLQRREVISWLKWPFAIAAIICPVVNLILSGMPWSIVADWSLLIIWTTAVSPDLVQYNRISQTIKLIAQICILLALIEWCLAPGMSGLLIIPIVCFSGMILTGILFFTDIRRQKHNILPMLLLTSASLLASVVCLILIQTRVWQQLSSQTWPIVVMLGISVALLLSCFITFGADMLKELKKLFHTR